MTNLTVVRKSIAKRFKWTDQHGNEWYPEEMSTHHLFFTIRMIWNHTAPIEARSNRYKKYRLYMSKRYLTNAVEHLGKELLTRTDILPSWQSEINEWSKYLKKHRRNKCLT